MLHATLLVIFKMSNPFAKFKINFCVTLNIFLICLKKITGLTKHYTRWATCYSICRHFCEYILSKLRPNSSLFICLIVFPYEF